jgi:hypothetical protein
MTRLPGNRDRDRARRASLHERLTPADRVRCEAAILVALAAYQPIGRGRLREVIQCGITDKQLMGLLRQLRKQRKVRRVGTRVDALWALWPYVAPPRPAPAPPAAVSVVPPKPRTAIPPRPPAPEYSWWATPAAQASRAAFNRELHEAQPRMDLGEVRKANQKDPDQP